MLVNPGSNNAKKEMAQSSEHLLLKKWPRGGLIKRLKKIQQDKDQMHQIRTSLILEGLKSSLPQGLSLETVDSEETPFLYEHF